MSRRGCLAFALLLSTVALADEDASRLQFPESGFSIEAIAGPSRTVSIQPLILALPAVDGFAANVNVQVQPFGGSLTQYVQLTRDQLSVVEWELLDEPTIEGATATVDYAGTMDGRQLRFYATATKRGDRVYLVTATAPRARWDDSSAVLRRCVDSFRLEPGD